MKELVFDFEVTPHDWLVVFFNRQTNELTVIENDVYKLHMFYKKHENDLFIGFNSVGYDVHVLKAILLGNNPYEISQFIIADRRKDLWNCPGHSEIYQKYPINVFDVKTSGVKQKNFALSLKEAECNLGLDIIENDFVSWNIDRKLTRQELDDMIHYCKNDVLVTNKLYESDVVQNDLSTVLNMIGMIQKHQNIPFHKLIRSTVAKLAALVVRAKKLTLSQQIEPTFEIPNELNVKDKDVLELFETRISDYGCSLTKMVGGIETSFGLGGMHGALPNYIKPHDKEVVLIDVDSFYPNVMLKHNVASRALKDMDLYVKMLNDRIKLKQSGDPLANVYKLVLNIVFGAALEKYSLLYDKHNGTLIPVYGQLFLLDLIEKLVENKCGKMVQYNTDGIAFEIWDKDEMYKQVKLWEDRTGFHMTYDFVKTYFQKDVNNYILEFDNGEIKVKGAFVKPYNNSSFMKNHLVIIANGIVDYILYGITPEETVMKCDDPMLFQFLGKHTMKFDSMWHMVNGKRVKVSKTNRVFATHDKSYGILEKRKDDSYHKLASCPQNAFIMNGKVDENKELIFSKLDRQWYIDLIWERINMFLGKNDNGTRS